MTSQSASPSESPKEYVTPESVLCDVLDHDAGVDVDALALEDACGDLGDVGVLGRQDAVDGLSSVTSEPRRA